MDVHARTDSRSHRRTRTDSPVAADQLPDAEGHFADGILMMGRQKLIAAASCFQKACASATAQLAVTPWFASYLMENDQPRAHTQYLLARIYENMGHCFFDAGRIEDARFCADASRRLNAGSTSLSALVERAASIRQPANNHGLKKNSTGRAAPPHARPELVGKLTVLMATHFTDKLVLNRHLAPPGDGLVRSTYASMLRVFGADIASCTKLLIYDHKPPAGGQEDAYQDSLQKFAGEFGFDLQIFEHFGLQRSLANAFEKIRTPYVLWVEHDWEFLPPAVDLSELVSVFDRYPTVNVIRFNKRKNAISGFDFLMEKETRIEGPDLIRTAACSNNPQILRVAKMRRAWLPVCLADKVNGQCDLRGSAFGIEEPLFKSFMRDIRLLGFTAAHARWGTYVYGRINAQPKIHHLGC